MLEDGGPAAIATLAPRLVLQDIQLPELCGLAVVGRRPDAGAEIVVSSAGAAAWAEMPCG